MGTAVLALRCLPVPAENAAGIRILEKLGFRRTAVRAGGFLRTGQAMDIWAYEKVLAKKEAF